MARKFLLVIGLAALLSGCASVNAAQSLVSEIRQPCPGLQYWGLRWSPDGNSLVVLVYQGGQEPQLALMSPIGSILKPLASHTPGMKGDPRWSPDGTRVAFTSQYQTNADIYVTQVADGATTRISHRPQNDVLPSWSPDGEWLAYAALDGRADHANQIIVAEADGSRERVVRAGSALVNALAWSPDGQWIAVSEGAGNGEIFLLDPASGAQVALTDRRGDDQALAWSPDGKRLAFHAFRDNRSGIAVVNADGAGFRMLAVDVYGKTGPVWADADHVSYLSNAPENALMLANANTGETQRLTDFPVDVYFSPPSWSPDGSQAVFTAFDHSNPALASNEAFLLSRGDLAMTRITDNPGKYTCLRWPGS